MVAKTYPVWFPAILKEESRMIVPGTVMVRDSEAESIDDEILRRTHRAGMALRRPL
jgi:hypothetical protein